MAANLPARCGRPARYNSMYFGFRFLDWLAAALYAAAFVTSSIKRQPAV